MGRLVAARVGRSLPAAPGAAGLSGGGGEDIGAAAVALLARQHGLAAPAGSDARRARTAPGTPPAVAAGLGVGFRPEDVSVLAALAIGMVLLAVTALAAYALAQGHAGAQRRRSLLHGARVARQAAAPTRSPCSSWWSPASRRGARSRSGWSSAPGEPARGAARPSRREAAGCPPVSPGRSCVVTRPPTSSPPRRRGRAGR